MEQPIQRYSQKTQCTGRAIFGGIPGIQLISSVMGGYDGHRGWINYLAVHPEFQARGYGNQLMDNVETRLRKLGCPKINLQIREGNDKVLSYYQKLGFVEEKRISMGKRLEDDQ